MTQQEYKALPPKIKSIIDSWDDNKELYSECKRIQKELENNKYTCDYGLDGVVYDVREVNVA